MDGTFVTKTEEKGRKAGEEEKGNKKGKKIGSKTRKERKEKSAVDSIGFIPRRKDSEEWCGGEKWRKTKGREKRGARERRLGRWKRAVKGKKRGGKGRKKGGKGRGEKEKGAWRVCIFFFLFFFFHPFNDHPPVVLSADRGRRGARGKCRLRGCGTF